MVQSNFIFFVQTGLLAWVSVYGSFDAFRQFTGSRSVNHAEKVMEALQDAQLLEQRCPKQLGSNDAKQFVGWATLGTEFEWIKKHLGPRRERSY